MKRVFSIFLLILFAFNIGGFLFLFSIQRFQIRKELKKEIKKNLPLGSLAKITITSDNKDQVFWEHESEFCYLGIMYDVVKKVETDTQETVYYCITDIQETKLFKKLDLLVARGMENKLGGPKSLQYFFKFLSSLYSFNNENFVYNNFKNSFLLDLIHFYNQPWLYILSPPPQSF